MHGRRFMQNGWAGRSEERYREPRVPVARTARTRQPAHACAAHLHTVHRQVRTDAHPGRTYPAAAS